MKSLPIILLFIVFFITIGSSQNHEITIHPGQRVASVKLTSSEYSSWISNNDFNNELKRKTLVQDIYRKFDDKFDFIFLILNETNQPGNLTYAGQLIGTSNAVSGTGQSIYNFDIEYGSAGKLKSVMALTRKDFLLYGPSLHELMHNWGNFLISTKDWNGSSEYNAIPHWGFTGGNTKGQLGGFQQSTLQSNIGGNPNKYSVGSFGGYANGGNSVPYTDLELYLMGMIPITSVATFDVFKGITQFGINGSNYEFTASTKVSYTNSQILSDAGGPRTPSYSSSQKSFRLLVIVLTPVPLTENEWLAYDDQAEKFSRTSSIGPQVYNFWEATRGIGKIQSGNLQDALISKYTFKGIGNWSDSSNWVNNTPPPDILPPNIEIIVDNQGAGDCILDVPQYFETNGKLTVKSGSNLKIIEDIEGRTIDSFNMSVDDINVLDSIGAESPASIILPNTNVVAGTMDVKSNVISSMLNYAKELSDKKIQIAENLHPAGGIYQPAHYGLAYRWGGFEDDDDKSITKRLRPTGDDADATHKLDSVFGTDCEGLMINLVRHAGIKILISGSTQFPKTFSKMLQAKSNYNFNGLRVDSLGSKSPSEIKNGDFIVWKKIGHIGIIYKDGAEFKVFNSNGNPNPETKISGTCEDAECEQLKNRGDKRGVHPIKYTDAVSWFGAALIYRLENINVSTNPISSQTATSVISGGIVTYAGVNEVFERGVCWSLKHNPTVKDNKIVDQSGNNSFTSSIEGLIEGKSYFIRAYVEIRLNSKEKGIIYYGDEVPINASSEGIFIDPRDGQEYPYKTIGTQVWMTKNLNYLPTACISCALYGGLYNFNTALTIAPKGWHLPSSAEWMTLINYLGGNSVAGGALKNTMGWTSPNLGATNSSGFTALSGGFITNAGSPYGAGSYCGWWSSTAVNTFDVFYVLLDYNSPGVYSSGIYHSIEYGWSVRLIKD